MLEVVRVIGHVGIDIAVVIVTAIVVVVLGDGERVGNNQQSYQEF